MNGAAQRVLRMGYAVFELAIGFPSGTFIPDCYGRDGRHARLKALVKVLEARLARLVQVVGLGMQVERVYIPVTVLVLLCAVARVAMVNRYTLPSWSPGKACATRSDGAEAALQTAHR